MNKVILMGRLTANPELKQTSNNDMVCSFTVAVPRDYAPQGQESQSDFIRVIAWKHTADFVSKYFSKGKMIAVEGKLRTSSYKDSRHPDVTHYVTEVNAEKVYFTGEKANTGTNTAAQNPGTQQTPPEQYVPLQGMQDSFYDDFEEVIGGDENLPF